MKEALKYILAENGKSQWKIVVGKEASPSEIHAGEELQHFIEEICGAELPIVNDEGEASSYEILVGCSRHLDAIGENIDWEKLGSEGFIIRTVKDSIIIAGGRERGTLYGVYTFLEDYLGCRWLSSKVSRIPKRDVLKVPEIDVLKVPALEYREPFYVDAYDGDWAVRNKANGNFHKLQEKHGGKIKYSRFVHTFNSLVPVEEYFDTHPEYFSEINGVRIKERTQLCLTNPEVLEIAINRVKQWLKDDPEIKIVSVSQNDWYNPCQCEKCRAIDEAEGSHSGTLIHFVNKVAEAIEEDYPNVAVDTLAYQYTRKAPKNVRPRHNVIVRLCSIECCFSHPLETCQEISYPFKGRTDTEASFAKDLQEWSKVCNRLYIWDYVTNFANYVMPFPNLRVLQPNIQFFVRNNVKGVFEEGNNSDGDSGELAELRAYMLAKLLWDPDCDIDLIMNEFLTGYYGAAAGPIRQYINMLHDKVEKENIHMGIYDPPTSDYLTKDVLDKADELFDRAERLADDDEILGRVRIARLPLRYVHLSTMPKDYPNRSELIDEFFKDAVAAGVNRLKEGRNLEFSRKLMEEGRIVY